MPIRRFTWAQIETMRADAAAGTRQTVLAARYGMSSAAISKIINGHNYKRRSPYELPEEQREVYRLYRRKSFTREEAFRAIGRADMVQP